MDDRRQEIPSALQELRFLSTEPEICAAHAADASGLRRIPDAVARPGSEEEVVTLVRRCARAGVALTPQGLRSSTTGAAVPARGIVLSLERMNRLRSIDADVRTATAEPGIVTADFKGRVAAAGLFYPPDPTSEEESTLGGNVACNASGSRTYRYGATRGYVRALRLVLADGTVTEVRRVGAAKNASGYFGLQDPIDLWIGSEGTLGVITEITVDLRDPPPGVFGALAFFPDWPRALDFVLAADAARRAGQLHPRCLELFDRQALDLVSPEAGGMRIPSRAGAAIFFEEEVAPAGRDASLARWGEAITTAGGWGEATLIALSTEERQALRRLRHAIPTAMNERGEAAVRQGGRRVGTDFAVPLTRLPRMIAEAYQIIAEHFDGFAIAYGHVGSGHPHFNLLAEDPGALRRAEAAARAMSRRALDLGGTLSGEHGIGKVKAALYRDLYPSWQWAAARALKQALDPEGLLSPGNLFEE